MNAYQFRAVSHAATSSPYSAARLFTPELTVASLEQALPSAVVKVLAGSNWADYRVVLQWTHGRQSHAEALDAIGYALTSLGFAVVDLVVTEWATAAVEGALLGALGIGTLGATTDDPAVALTSVLVGAVAGAIVGAAKTRIRASYLAHRTPTAGSSGWTLSALPDDSDTQVYWRPDAVQ